MPTENRDSSQAPSQAPTQATSDVALVEHNFTSSAIELANRNLNNATTDDEDKTPILSDKSSKDFSDWKPWEKRLIVFTASSAALFSPLSANIYFPIFNTLAKDLHVTNTLINLTVTTYMVSPHLLTTPSQEK